MAQDPADNTSRRAALPAREVRVVNWPLRDTPARTAGALLACGAVGLVAGVAAASWSMGLVAAATVAISCWKLWIPVTGVLGPQGITVAIGSWRRRIAWRDIDHIEFLEGGIFLCPPYSDGPLAGFAGLYLPWPRQRELVMEYHAFFRPGSSVPAAPPRTEDRSQSEDGWPD